MSFSFQNSNSAPGRAKSGFGNSEIEDPLADVEYSNDLASDCGKEFSALQDGFKKRAKAEKDRFTRATDSEFWFAVCFSSREEKEAFLRAAKVRKQLMGDKYIDGRMLARLLKIDYDH